MYCNALRASARAECLNHAMLKGERGGKEP